MPHLAWQSQCPHRIGLAVCGSKQHTLPSEGWHMATQRPFYTSLFLRLPLSLSLSLALSLYLSLSLSLALSLALSLSLSGSLALRVHGCLAEFLIFFFPLCGFCFGFVFLDCSVHALSLSVSLVRLLHSTCRVREKER